MPITPEHQRRLAKIKAQTDALGVKGIFTENGKSLAEMAFLLWEQGFIAVPTSECLLMALEQRFVASYSRGHTGASETAFPNDFNRKPNNHT